MKVPSWRAAQHIESTATSDLLAEIAVHSELQHLRIVPFVGACLDSEAELALVTELALGGNLHQALHSRRYEWPLSTRLSLAGELLEALVYLHSRRPAVAHLDVKSMNVVLDADGQHLQLCDFGLARAVGPDGEVSEFCGGSPRYMSPERHDSSLGSITVLADVWSAGCVFIELFGNAQPYADCSNAQQILTAILVHRCGPCIPDIIEAGIRDFTAAALTFEPQERPSAWQGLQQLRTIEAKEPPGALPAVHPSSAQPLEGNAFRYQEAPLGWPIRPLVC